MNPGKGVLAESGAGAAAQEPSRTAASSQSDSQAIVVDMGKARPKGLKQLAAGKGKLSAKVLAALEQVRASYGTDTDVELVPVVMIYTRKKKRRSLR
jgi:hypothetical protein